MEKISIKVLKSDVYEEVAKATDYTGSKLIDGDENARDRILAADDDLTDLGRFWEESVLAVNEKFKEMLISGSTQNILFAVTPVSSVDLATDEALEERVTSVERPSLPSGKPAYVAEIEVSKSFDKTLTDSVQSTLRSFFIASIIGQWFKFANKGEAADYFTQAADMIETAERLLYSRRKPTKPKD